MPEMTSNTLHKQNRAKMSASKTYTTNHIWLEMTVQNSTYNKAVDFGLLDKKN